MASKFIKAATSLLVVAFSFASKASSEKDLFKGLNYPELQVSPLASQRIKIENDLQADRLWTNNLMYQISGFTTLAAALTASASSDFGVKDDFDNAKLASIAVGSGWLIGATALSYFYKPYNKAMKRIEALPAKTKQQKIIRERIAEEELMAASKLIKKLKWFSFLSNLAVTINLSDYSDSGSKGGIAVAALGSILPLLFKHNYQHAADQHSIYKKKIYGPVFGTGLLQTPDKEKTILGLQASLNF